MVSKWAQELLGYNFSVIHRPVQMMVDVDTLSRRYGILPSQHMQISSILALYDKE